MEEREAALEEPEVVWAPLAGSQTLALTAPADEVLYAGTRGPGKSDCQLMRFRMRVGLGYGRFWRGIIFDRRYKSLDDLVQKSKRWFPKFNDGAIWHSSHTMYKWEWPTGEELLFRFMLKDTDYESYHGHEYPFIGYNELQKYPTSLCYDKMASTNRSSFDPVKDTPKDAEGRYLTQDGKPLPPIPLEIVSTANPHGPGHNWVKQKFVDVGAPGEIIKKTSTIFNPQTQQEEDVTRTQVYIFGTYKENKYLDPKYIATLDAETDPARRKAWLEGDWDIVVGGAFDDCWDTNVHVLDRFPIPTSWRIVRAMDWGSAHPFSIGWFAVSNGEEFEHNGIKMHFPARTSIQIGELYGARLLNGSLYGHNQGSKLDSESVAQKVIQYEEYLKDEGWVQTTPRPGPADRQIYGSGDQKNASIASRMSDLGVKWVMAKQGKDTRINGYQLVRQALRNALDKKQGGLFFIRNCQATIQTVPYLPRDEKNPDDVDTKAEDHAYDMIKYLLLDETPEYVSEHDVRLPY
jgi:hypothetical protein